MCIDVEYVQKKCTRTHTAAISIISFFLNFRTRARSRVLVLRNVANKEKNGRTTIDMGYVVVRNSIEQR